MGEGHTIISVLYVDDEADMLEITKVFLERGQDMEVTAVDSADRGLELLRSSDFHIVISDFQMPGMNGLSLLQEIRRSWGELPFILLTGKGREEVAIDALNLGANYYVQKGSDIASLFVELRHKVLLAVERHAMGRSLVESEARYRGIVENLPGIIFEAEFGSDRPFFLDGDVSALTGYTKDELLTGRIPWQDVLHPDDARMIMSELNRSSGSDGLHIDMRLRHKNGSIRWVKGHMRYLDQQPPMPVQWVIFDVDELHGVQEDLMAANMDLQAAEEKLRNQLEEVVDSRAAALVSEMRFRALFDTMQEGMALHRLVLDDDGTPVDYMILDVNRSYERIIGLRKEDVIGKTGSEAYGVKAPYLDEFSKVAITGMPDSMETYFAPLDTHFLISIFSPGKGEFATVFIDVSESHRLHAEMASTQAKLRQVLDLVPGPVYVKDSEGRYTDFNAAFERYFGKDRGQLLDRTDFDLFGEQVGEVVAGRDREVIKRVMMTEYSEQIERDGKMDWFLTRKAPLIDKDGKVQGLVGLSLDLSKIEMIMEHDRSHRTK